MICKKHIDSIGYEDRCNVCLQLEVVALHESVKTITEWNDKTTKQLTDALLAAPKCETVELSRWNYRQWLEGPRAEALAGVGIRGDRLDEIVGELKELLPPDKWPLVHELEKRIIELESFWRFRGKHADDKEV